MYWELFKRFPSLPPFGPGWFRSLQELDNPISQLRLDWMFLNMQHDNDQEAERRKAEIEYGGFFANPDVYLQLKNQEKRHKVFRPFRVEYDTSDFDRRVQLALEGNPEIHEQDVELAERVRRKRIDIETMESKADPRIVRPLTDEEYESGDELIVETREPGDDG